MKRRFTTLYAIAGVAALLVARGARGQATFNVPLSVSEARPLAKAAEILEVKYALLVNYEDPAYVHDDDVRDDSDPKHKEQNPSARALSVRGGHLDASLAVRPDGRALANPLQALETLTESHNSRGLPGSFRVQQAGEFFNIVPNAVKDRSGRLTPTNSPLDSKISISEREVTGMQTVELICEEVSKVSGFKVLPGLLPNNLLNNKTGILKARNQVARDVLRESLSGLRWTQTGISIPPRKLVWQLFYAPGPETYYLHLHVAMKEVPDRFVARTVQVPQ